MHFQYNNFKNNKYNKKNHNKPIDFSRNYNAYSFDRSRSKLLKLQKAFFVANLISQIIRQNLIKKKRKLLFWSTWLKYKLLLKLKKKRKLQKRIRALQLQIEREKQQNVESSKQMNEHKSFVVFNNQYDKLYSKLKLTL